jgi:cbb3-type cytochrome oxidase subunit 3
MRLSDIVGYVDLSTYPQAALVLFLGVFAAVAWRSFRRDVKEELEAIGRLPLED